MQKNVLTRAHDYALMNFSMYVAQLSEISVFLLVYWVSPKKVYTFNEP